ncbi:hypothetical protein [Kribbella sp. NBC_00889]|uniref:hypothetical protein n=1 Tax=Kribbella sp. NBC_00889 TaxID=2975974 RepID=UPI00386A95E0|nr:S1 family peptidase [Kribbella sp. NBC_00889]
MSRPKTKLLALAAIAASLTCVSAANAAGSIEQDGSYNVQGAQADPSPTPADPNFAPYPDCEVLLRTKPGSCDPDQPIQLDITGDVDKQAQVDQVQAAMDKESGRDGGLKWDSDRNVLLVRLVGPIDGSSPAVEHAKATALNAGKGLSIEFQSVKYSRAELEALDNQLLPTQKEWAPGLPQASGGWDPDQNRVVLLVRNNTGKTAAWTERVKELQDERVSLQFYTPKPDAPDGDFELQVSRLSDSAPWWGGDWLSSTNITPTTSNAQCTSGFNWKLWDTGYFRGSTANHCTGTGWFHSGQVWGIPEVFSPAADTQLIREVNNQYNFAPNVWVGSQDTIVARAVRAVDSTISEGETVALSGARSGLNVGHVIDTSYYVSSIQAYVVLMDTTACMEGDSGAPWLTTMSASGPYPGSVVAYGQHRGESFVPGHEGCGWTPVTYISSKVHASLLVVP